MSLKSTKPQAHLIFWSVSAFLFIGFVWLFKGVLTPFVLGIAIAYLLNPVVNALTKLKIPRLAAVIIILLSFFIFVIGVITIAAPPLAREASALAESFPGYIDRTIEFLNPYLGMAQERFGGNYTENIQGFLKDNVGKIVSLSGGLAGGLASGGQAVIGFFTTLLLAPLVAFFMMQEWPKITKWVNDLIPRENEKTIQGLLKKMDFKVAGFVRGQITVAFFLGVIYAIALTIAGLNYGFLIGITAGFLSIIPLVGSTVGLLVSVIVAWFQMGEISYVAIIAAIFVVGQIVEGNILTPKLVGDSVGLHPVWVLFALLAGGSLFGIVGMLLGVPVAAVVGVLLSFSITEYKKSTLYAAKTPAKTVTKKTSKKSTIKKKTA
ncbi:MAG: AI-2E family transporter [Alphaproteobacteria bacterium]|nr:AI-2E family transporter [Alphaproteobacteria bacterium]NCQ87409.1 AI-2E family transporter [Alphaproteobacteria bacterium]NCT06280.1 AI-2E family transporter [Alphaproteobacteria bacterium]